MGKGPDLDSEGGRVDLRVTRTLGCMLIFLYCWLGDIFMFYRRVFTPAIADSFFVCMCKQMRVHPFPTVQLELDLQVIVFIDDILVYSPDEASHAFHLRSESVV